MAALWLDSVMITASIYMLHAYLQSRDFASWNCRHCPSLSKSLPCFSCGVRSSQSTYLSTQPCLLPRLVQSLPYPILSRRRHHPSSNPLLGETLMTERLKSHVMVGPYPLSVDPFHILPFRASLALHHQCAKIYADETSSA